MASVSTYLNFPGTTEEAFAFYAEVFGTQVEAPIFRLGDGPPQPGAPELSEEDLAKVMHMELPILAGHVLHGTDMLESMGQQTVVGNNTTINLTLDTDEEADRLHDALAEGGSDDSGMMDQFWGRWGCCLDRYGVRWMFNGPPAEI